MTLQRRIVPRGTTLYTYQLAGATLRELLDAADRDEWPSSDCDREWALLRNWAMQTESLMCDESESLAWQRKMRELAHSGFEYSLWVEERQKALRDRQRARKLVQGRLRDRYGYKRPRRWGLIARDIRAFYGRWSAT